MKKSAYGVLVGVFVWLALASSGFAQSYTYNISQTRGNWKFLYWDIPAGTAKIRVDTYGGYGDVDLYLRYTSRPTTSTYWRRSIRNGNVEVIEVSNPPAGRIYIGLAAYQTFGGVTLKVQRWAQTTTTNWRTDMLNRVNYERGRYSRVKLSLVTPLINAAQVHASDMARRNFMSHTGSDGSSVQTRITRQGYFTGYRSYGWAENVAAGQTSVAAVMTAWMNSTTHRNNILNSNMRHFGCGYGYNANARYKRYWCQTFGYRYP